MTLRQLQEQAAALGARHGWETEGMETRALYLVSEVGEVARELVELARGADALDRDAARRRLGLEMYDVLWNLANLANGAGVDLEAAAAEKAARNATRTWPS